MATINAVVNTMMSSDSGITAVVTTTASGTRIYPVTFPANPTFPLIVYRQISGNEILRSAPHGTVVLSTRFQIDTWAETYAGTQTLREELVDLFTDYRGVVSSKNILSSRVDLAFDLYESDTMLYRHTIDVSIQHEGA